MYKILFSQLCLSLQTDMDWWNTRFDGNIIKQIPEYFEEEMGIACKVRKSPDSEKPSKVYVYFDTEEDLLMYRLKYQ